VDEVMRAIERARIAPRKLKLELTESLLADGIEVTVAKMGSLKDMGVTLSLDDFGMGYSALSYLQRLPVQTLKIDRAFVSGLENAGNFEIVRAILALASGLSMNVTAEGVETADQAARLKDLSCEFAQGYFFNRPLTRDRARDVLEKYHRSIGAQLTRGEETHR